MAHFAQIDESGIVLRVVVIDNENTINEDGVESEVVGVAFCQSLFGNDTNWVQTSYNSSFRKNYASVGGTWDAENDAFYEIRPFPSWNLDSDFKWQAPEPMPNPQFNSNGDPLGTFFWDEQSYNLGNGGWVLARFKSE